LRKRQINAKTTIVKKNIFAPCREKEIRGALQESFKSVQPEFLQCSISDTKKICPGVFVVKTAIKKGAWL
jgi:hypothetical protein